MFKDLELQQWSVPEDTQEGYVLLTYIKNLGNKTFETLYYAVTVRNPFPADGECNEVCDCIFLKVNRNS